jgi:hypothetical protein
MDHIIHCTDRSALRIKSIKKCCSRFRPFRYIRFLSNQDLTTQKSDCELTEFEVYGVRYSASDADGVTSKSCDVVVSSNNYIPTTPLGQVIYEFKLSFFY